MKLTTHLSNYLNDSLTKSEAYYALGEQIKTEASECKDELEESKLLLDYNFEWAGLTIAIDAQCYFKYNKEDGAFLNELEYTEVDLSEIWIIVHEDNSVIEIDLIELRKYLK